MDTKHKVPFFNAEDIALLQEFGREKYDKNNVIHLEIGEQLKNGVWEKVIYWSNQVVSQLESLGYTKKNTRRRWQNSGSFKYYFLNQIYKQVSKNDDVYFSVGVGQVGIHYEIDYQQDSKNLTVEQKTICNTLIKERNDTKVIISPENIHEYSWDSLIKETIKFVTEYSSLYDEIIKKISAINQKRIARITYNDQGWVRPSGEYGKSEAVNSFEAENGYGHEEWLFDISKIYKGYHYAFLEPIRKEHQAYVKANPYDVVLFTINGETKQRYYIGVIFNVEVISETEAQEVCQYYKKQGWLDDMIEQVENVSDYEGFSNWKGLEVFNIRFKISDISQPPSLNNPIPQGHPIYSLNRYSFNIYKEEYKLQECSTSKSDSCQFETSGNSMPDEDVSKPKTRIYDREPKTIEIQDLHYVISNKLHKKLIDDGKNVKSEVDAGYENNKVDIVVREDDGDIYYEVKTYTSLKTSIRVALGQLLEYAMWTNYNRAKELVIVTQRMSNIEVEEAKEYFAHIRKTYNIPLYYQSFDIETNELSEKV